METSERARAPSWHLPAVLGLAVLVRAYAWSRALTMMNDGPDFLWQAQRLLAGEWLAALEHSYHPGYALATAAVAALTGAAIETAAISASILGGLLVVLASWGITRLALPDRPGAAALTALVAALAPRLVDFSADVQSDGLFLGLFATSLWLLVLAARRGGCRRSLAGAGLAAGLAYLTRPEGLFLLVALGLWVVAGLRRGGRPARRLAGAGVFVIALALPVIPYAWAIHVITGSWGLSMKPSVAAIGLASDDATREAPAASPLGSPIVPRLNPERQEAWRAEALRLREQRRAAEDATAAGRGSRADDAATGDPASGRDAVPQTAPQSPTPTGPPRARPARDEDARASDATPNVPVPGGADDTPGEPDTAAEAAATSATPSADRPDVTIDMPVDPAVPADATAALGWAVRASLDELVSTLRGELLLLLVVGLAVTVRRRPALVAGALALVVAYLAFGVVQFYVNNYMSKRHMMIPVIALLPLAGPGIAWLWTRRGAARLPLRALVLLCFVVMFLFGTRPKREDDVNRLRALAWARQTLPPGERLVVHRRRDGWYADRPVLVVLLPCDDGKLLRFMDEHGAEHLVLDEPKVDEHAPHWLGPDAPFETVRRFDDADGDEARTVIVLRRRA